MPSPPPSAVAVCSRPVVPLAGRRLGGRRALSRALPAWTLALLAPLNSATPDVRGIPFTRLYPYEEISGLTGPSYLTFDRFGRLAAIQDGIYVALNDTTWIDLVARDDKAPRILSTVRDADGTVYFGGFLTWGTVETTSTGALRARAMRPADCPRWAASTSFNQIVCAADGVYFAGWNGVVFRNRRTGAHAFFAIDGVARIFPFQGSVYVSSHASGVKRINVERGALEDSFFRDVVVDNAVELDDGSLLVSTSARRLQVYRGGQWGSWTNSLGERLPSRVLCMRRLTDGHVALSVAGLGVFVMRQSGEVISSLTLPEYRRAVDLASNEPGVLWVATESGIAKVLYGSPITTFGQPLGLPISWPQLVRWRDRLVIASAGRLYEPVEGSAMDSTRFQLVPGQPGAGAWGIAASEDRLLIGNREGVYARMGDAPFAPVLRGCDVSRLALLDQHTCLVIGSDEIAALRWQDGGWRECAPRIPGFGYPSIVHAANGIVWIELGANRAARIVLRGDRIDARLFEQFPWKESRWIDISMLGPTTILTGGDAGRVFFDEESETLKDDPTLAAFLDRAPSRILRLRRGDDGTLWASHEHGLLRFAEKTGYDSAPYDLIHERSPQIHLLPRGETWISTGNALLRIEHQPDVGLPGTFQPRLVSVRDKRHDMELLQDPSAAALAPLPYSRNSLEFRLFAGGYASRRPPAYQVRLDDEQWTQLGEASVLSVSDLREGNHRLELRLVDAHGRPGETTRFDFAITPPWHRTWYAVLVYASAAVLLVRFVVRRSVRRTQKRNRELTDLVEKRTEELRAAMQKLNEEARNSATLTERQRLAGEIHDSLQQGLTGLTLQIDATLKLPELSDEARSRLTLARSMVSYSRHEVQNAVLGMESPLLDHADLAAALRKLSEFIGIGLARIEVSVLGAPRTLTASMQHNLLRIAQEAVTNAVRHGAADVIRITLDYEPEALTLRIQDNGCGFDLPAAVRNGSGHFGLRSLRSRAKQVGGEAAIDSAPGKGTTVVITLPHPPNEPHANSR
ncbi:MAG TPA: sensor histidine kinase [Opitutaceae bacterium]|nr:sensor histidine kinase [Opitutaceae bacterium]